MSVTEAKNNHPSELWHGYWGIQVLQAGQALGFFEALREKKTIQALAKCLNLENRYTEMWCEAAHSYQLLDLDDGHYGLPEHCKEWLLQSQGYTQSHIHLSRRMNETLRAVFGGRALPEPPISLRLLLQENLQANYRWVFQTASDQSARLNTILSGPGRVLEVGCGVGYGLGHLRSFYPQLELFGLETDFECAQEAERSTKSIIHIGELPGERFARGFDLVVCFRTLSAAKEPERLLKECAELLNPDGVFILGSELADKDENRKSTPRVQGEKLTYNILAGDRLINSYTQAELEQMLKKSGFADFSTIDAPDWATPVFVCSTT